MARFAFHPDALLEYADATNYYLGAATPTIAERFVAAVESEVALIVADPELLSSRRRSGHTPFCLQAVSVRSLLSLAA